MFENINPGVREALEVSFALMVLGAAILLLLAVPGLIPAAYVGLTAAAGAGEILGGAGLAGLALLVEGATRVIRFTSLLIPKTN